MGERVTFKTNGTTTEGYLATLAFFRRELSA